MSRSGRRTGPGRDDAPHGRVGARVVVRRDDRRRGGTIAGPVAALVAALVVGAGGLEGRLGAAVAASSPPPFDTAADRALDRERLLERLVELELPLGVEALLEFERAAGITTAADAARGRLALAELQARAARDPRAVRVRTLALVEARQALLDATREAAAGGGDAADWWAELAAAQAADLFVHALAADGADPGLLHGLPDAAERRRALATLARTREVAREADQALDERIAALARAADADRGRLARLREERDGRTRVVRAAATVLAFLAGPADGGDGAGPDADGGLDHDGAVRELEDASRTLPPPWASIAQLWHGRGRLDRTPEQAATILRTLAADDGVGPGVRLAAALSAADAVRRSTAGERGATAGLAAGLEALLDPRAGVVGGPAAALPGAGTRLAIADAAARQVRDAVAGGARLDAESAARVLEAYLAIPTLDPRTVRSRLARLHPAWPDAPDPRLPAQVLAAAGTVLAGDRPEAAAAWLDLALERHAREPRTLEGAGFVALERARLLDAAGRTAEAIELLGRTALAGPDAPTDDPTFVVAADAALRRAAARDAATLAETGARLLPARADAAALDPWRRAAAQAALAAGTDAGAERALLLLAAPLEAGRAEAADELLQVAAWRILAGRAALDEVRASHWRSVRTAAPALDAKLAATGRADDRARLRAWEAEALLDLGRPQAALDRLDAFDAEGVAADPHVAAELVRVRLVALAELAGGGDPAVLERTLAAWFETVPPADAGAAAVAERLLAGMVAADDDASGLRAAAAALDRWLAAAVADGAPAPVGLGLRLGEAWRALEEPARALAWYDRLAERFPDAAEVLDGRAACLFARGGEEDLAEAMTLYRRLGAGGPSPDDARAAERWWRARLRQLEILERVGRADGRIAAQVERLRRQDPELGGPELRAAFERLAQRHRGG